MKTSSAIFIFRSLMQKTARQSSALCVAEEDFAKFDQAKNKKAARQQGDLFFFKGE